nr:serine hydrolase [uncultured Chryseobacterium sp.]
MKKLNIIILLFLSINIFSQRVNDKIKLFENDFFHWDKSKTKKVSLKDRMALYNTNAVSIAVIKNYKVEWVKAYGFADVSEKRLATAGTLFQAGSISKSMNSLGILKLVQEGKLGLDDDINNDLKTWKFPYDETSKGKKITIANLLSHTAGLSGHGFGGYEKGAILPTTIQILDGLKPSNSGAIRSVFEPGLKFQYSGGGTTILQLILENTTGEKYEDYMLKNVLNPLEMSNSSFNQPPPKDKENLLATAYNYESEVRGKYHIYPEKAAAGLWTNPTDLAKYVIETQLSLQGKSNKILSKEMMTKRLENNFGVFVEDYNGTKYFRHGGGTDGFLCYDVGSMEGGNGIVVMINGSNNKLIEEIVTSIASLNQFKNYPKESSKESISLTIRKELNKSVDKGIKLYKKLKKTQPKEYNFSNESELNMLGYEYMNHGKMDEAIKIFSLNISTFPNSANVYDSRGEVYFNKKEYELSKKDYQKVLELEPTNPNAKEMLLKIEKEISRK